MTDVKLKLNVHEATMLRDLVEQMRALLKESEAPDPIHARLFPDAYEGAEDSAAYREMVGGDLAASKLEALERVSETLADRRGNKTTLSAEDAEAWIRALTDMRLAIGTRLDVTSETMDVEPDSRDPGYEPWRIMHWLGWLQESILDDMVT